MNTKILGVLGGMGPLASATFMVRLTLLTDAARDQDHICSVLWSDPTVPDRTLARQGGASPLPALSHGIAVLRAAGAGAIAIPCNTAHGWYEPLCKDAGVPILHIVEAAANELRRHVARGRVGVLGTSATLAMRLYQDRLEAMGWEVITPDDDEMARLVTPGIAAVKANRVREAYGPLADAALRLKQRGAQAVVLGCTEIPLGIQAGPYAEIGLPLIDTIDALALAAIAWTRLP
jgi:aspartate racemase